MNYLKQSRTARPSVFDYTLTLTRKRRYLVIGLPEFGFQITSQNLELDRLKPEALGREVLKAFDRAHRALLNLEQTGRPFPKPLTPQSAQQWVAARQAARALGVSTSTLRRMVKSGALSARRTPGGHLRFSIENLSEQLLDSNSAARLSTTNSLAPSMVSDSVVSEPAASKARLYPSKSEAA